MLVMNENWAEKLEGLSGVIFGLGWAEVGKKKQQCDVYNSISCFVRMPQSIKKSKED